MLSKEVTYFQKGPQQQMIDSGAYKYKYFKMDKTKAAKCFMNAYIKKII